MSTHIKPVVGRHVHFYSPPAQDPNTLATVPQRIRDQPLAAIITFVHSDELVNLVVFRHSGEPVGQTSVRLVQDGGAVGDGETYCSWMPFQVGQAQHQSTKDIEQFIGQNGGSDQSKASEPQPDQDKASEGAHAERDNKKAGKKDKQAHADRDSAEGVKPE